MNEKHYIDRELIGMSHFSKIMGGLLSG